MLSDSWGRALRTHQRRDRRATQAHPVAARADADLRHLRRCGIPRTDFERRSESNPRLVYCRVPLLDPQAASDRLLRQHHAAVAAASRRAPAPLDATDANRAAGISFLRRTGLAADCDLVGRGRALRPFARCWRPIIGRCRSGRRAARQNFAHRVALIGAEMARLEAANLDAMRLYERGDPFGARPRLRPERRPRQRARRAVLRRAEIREDRACLFADARYCYLRWGADGKVRNSSIRLTRICARVRAAPISTALGTPVDHLDLATIVKVSQALFGEIVLDRLMETLMAIAIEHAGADRGLLLLARGDDLRIEAEAKTSRNGVEVSAPPTRRNSGRGAPIGPADRGADPSQRDPRRCPKHRTRFLGTSMSARGAADRFCACRLTKQAKLIGVLYLENSLASDVFTPAADRRS